MTSGEYLLHPELLRTSPFAARLLRDRVAETLVDDPDGDANISIVVRTFNERLGLEQIFEDLHNQQFAKEVEVVVVDNESTDGTVDVARHYGAEVVGLRQDDFTYPKSLNKGVEAASHEQVFVTVGHAALSNVYNLHAAVRHFKDADVAGAYGTILPNVNASRTEKLIYALGDPVVLAKPAHKIGKAKMGALGATNAVLAKSAWSELGGFDERYAIGGEDTALARMMLSSGYDIVHEPALSVHHTHGLGPIDLIKQFRYWQQIVKGPHNFDKAGLLARRPDLRNNSTPQN